MLNDFDGSSAEAIPRQMRLPFDVIAISTCRLLRIRHEVFADLQAVKGTDRARNNAWRTLTHAIEYIQKGKRVSGK